MGHTAEVSAVFLHTVRSEGCWFERRFLLNGVHTSALLPPVVHNKCEGDLNIGTGVIVNLYMRASI